MIDFGKVATGTTSPPATFTVRNTGERPTGAFEFEVSAPFSADAGTCTEPLAAGASCSFTVTFSPTIPGAHWGEVEIVAGSGTRITADVRGTGVSPNQLALASAAHDFGTLIVGAPITPAIACNSTRALYCIEQ